MYYFEKSKIKELRQINDLTMSQLAKKVGVTEATISRWESGDRIPKADYLSNLANALGVSILAFYVNI